MDIMNDNGSLILIAPYDDLGAARRDFASLKNKLHEHRFEMREAVLLTKDLEGNPEVLETSANHARSGAGFGAGIGVLIGLLVPPFVASIAVGAAAGVLAAKFADHSLKSGLQHEVGEALEAGTGVVLAIVKPGGKAPVENALLGTVGISVIPFSDATINSLEAAIADAMNAAHADAAQLAPQCP